MVAGTAGKREINRRYRDFIPEPMRRASSVCPGGEDAAYAMCVTNRICAGHAAPAEERPDMSLWRAPPVLIRSKAALSAALRNSPSGGREKFGAGLCTPFGALAPLPGL